MSNTMINIRSQRKQSGIALISVMIIVVLVAALATQMHWEHRLSSKRIENLLIQDQAVQFAYGGESWAREILIEDVRNGSRSSDHLQEDWAQALPALPIDGGAIQGKIIDLQGRFNLNNLVNEKGTVDPVGIEQFQRLLQNLNIEIEIANAVADWIDSDDYPTLPGGAEDPSYTSSTKPYRTANHYISDTSELMSILGMTPAYYQLLLPYISALPIGTPININTAPDQVIASLSDSISIADVQYIIEQREVSPFEDISEFIKLLENTSSVDITEIKTPLVTETSYFVVEIEVSLYERVYRMHSYLYRDLNFFVASYQRVHSPDKFPVPIQVEET